MICPEIQTLQVGQHVHENLHNESSAPLFFILKLLYFLQDPWRIRGIRYINAITKASQQFDMATHQLTSRLFFFVFFLPLAVQEPPLYLWTTRAPCQEDCYGQVLPESNHFCLINKHMLVLPPQTIVNTGIRGNTNKQHLSFSLFILTLTFAGPVPSDCPPVSDD